MRSYTIVKALALSFGAVSVVARSLPEQRSEINAHAARGHGPSNPRQSMLEGAGAEIDIAMSKATTIPATLTTDVDDLKQHLQGLVKISEGVLNGKVNTSTYSIPADQTSPRRDTTLKKRDRSIEGAHCWTACANPPDLPHPDRGDCTELYKNLYSMAVQFSVEPHQATHYKFGNCGSLFVNNMDETVTYDFWDLGGTTQYLNGFCIIKNQAKYGACKFGDINTDINNAAFVAVVHPSYFGG